ncbi:hypothetical protein A3F00_04295 [Candidatus Daviesbacteria bacterium RIFCSPHIGHO2_12_FULL_37_11]|uniref:Uncharacterized protein n=1 Tax=Candidatus Daviesbacteria bacterium RIFCSPHIGHO2_12_FULL_37_11 TaxID=1797777 RepID=A0A1F5KA10_9BACT|nr:MAG: hypothetical protein A2111_01880 [Candidatus Daviesbacteria bacterium GWA1_38_6]OGE16121.1 MAG: hypothetical protein A2769_03465 [Candidatus Daviesbacteria bacterium RIFCSPHIGHO2_01_FULL_37_27]OGE37645.1 MAG: hypothetical protein A3F00_04295 [Candidatus Daviesbacteria bacterium RIFCSPHIGHO2_12_FULL_37_11]OGE45402.1 MAG: hypothetical protein A3B39_04695 [Candidatus Daviesbacteria bacterium RIFCSPLOWO2_01_FULL_37_10]
MSTEYKVDIEKQEDTPNGHWLIVHEIQTPIGFRRPEKETIERKFYPTPDDMVKDTGSQRIWNTVRGLGSGIGGSFIATATLMSIAQNFIHPEPNVANYTLAAGGVVLTGICFRKYIHELLSLSRFRKIHSTVKDMYYNEEGFHSPFSSTTSPPQA